MAKKKKWLSATINLVGRTTSDLEIALEEVKKKISEGYLGGQDSNDTGSYYFEVSECE